MRQVLIVGDDPNQRRLLTWEFSDEGYVVDTATSGREALDKIRNDQPAVVVLDLATRDEGGIDEVSRILNLRTRPAVVIYSAHSRSRFKRAMKPVDEFVMKSSDLALLKASVRKVAQRSVSAA